MKISIVVLACMAVVLATPVVKRQAPEAYTLPDGADLVLGSVVGGFSCENRIYGYYADVANACRVFHVCVPVTQVEGGPVETYMYSFFCGNTTVFDQQNLVCVNEQDAVPCSEAENLYSAVNERFGKTDSPPVRP